MKEPTNTEIMAKLISIQEQLDLVVNPMASVTISQKAKVLGEALKSRDKKKIKAARLFINAK